MKKSELNQMSSVRSWVMWFCAALFYAFQFILRVSPGVMAEDLMQSLDLNACVLGTLTSFYYYGYSVMQIPAGLLLDYFGPRKPLSLACFLCGIGCLLFAWGENIFFLSIGRTLMGIGSAFGILSCIKIASLWFPASRLSLFVGLSIMCGTLGASTAGEPLGHLVAFLGWQKVMLIFGGMSFLLTLLSWSVVRGGERKGKAQDALHEPVLKSIKDILKNPQTWFYGLYGFLMYLPLSGFADLWGAPYVASLYGVSATKAASAISTFYIGMGCGSPLWPWLVTYWESYRLPMVLSSLGLLSLFLLIVYGPVFSSFIYIYPLYFVAGFVAAGQMLAFGGVGSINPQSRAATASGFHNMLCMLSGTLAQPLMGKILDLNWGIQFEATSEMAALFDYRLAFGVLPLGCLLSILTVYFVKEAYPKERPSSHDKKTH